MAQPNFAYGDNVFVPYSVGQMIAYAKTCPEIRGEFTFEHPIFLREDPKEVLQRIGRPSIVGFSCYLWNWGYNTRLARLIKEAYPDCLIVFGGTQVPDASTGFFEKYPYVDLLVHHEGEITFAEIMRESLQPRPDYTRIPSLSIRVEGNRTHKTLAGGRVKDLSILPSPYLDGTFDFMLDRGYELNVTQETNRGCPYMCTFCDWGGSTFAKLFDIPEDRILEEFEWFGRQKVGYIFCADANFGIKPRDSVLIEKLIRVREKHHGYPGKFRMCTAKNSTMKILGIVQMLNDAGMNKGATLSFQSMDAHTLSAVRRSNIKLEAFGTLMQEYRKRNISTYTELIIGMPGETYESTKTGIDLLLEGQDDAVNIYAYVCSALPNSEMSAPEYVQKHGIKTVQMPILLAHSTPEPESNAEYQDVVVETATMPNADWQRTYLFYWAVQAFHCLGLMQSIAILFHKHYGMPYSVFYENLIEHFSARGDTLLGTEIARIKDIVRSAMNGGRLDTVLPRFGKIYWPLEEATFLNMVADKDRFYGEIRAFAGTLAQRTGKPVDEVLLDDAVRYQSAVLKGPYSSEITIDLRYDLYKYFKELQGGAASPHKRPVTLHVEAKEDFAGDLETYAREVVWYGRKGGAFYHPDITVKS